MAGFAGIAICYLLLCLKLHISQKTAESKSEDKRNKENDSTDEKLVILEEAGKFFGAWEKRGQRDGKINVLTPLQGCPMYAGSVTMI